MRLGASPLVSLILWSCTHGNPPVDAGVDPVDQISDVAVIDSDSALDAQETGLDSGDAYDGPWQWTGDGPCRPLPTAQTLTLPAGSRITLNVDASCGDGCTVVSTFVPGSYSWIVDDFGSGIVFSDNESIYWYSPPSQLTLIAGPPDGGGSACNWVSGGWTAITTINAGAAAPILLSCGSGDHEEMHQLDLDAGNDCVRYWYPFPPRPQFDPSAPLATKRVESAYVWLQANYAGPGAVYVLPDGATAPITIGNHVPYLDARGDVIAFTVEHLDNTSDLYVARPPFTSAQSIWSPHMVMGDVALDPDNPHHIVLEASTMGDTVCPRGADIYFVDLDTAGGIQPRALTHDAATQLQPLIRGDRVAYMDWVDDTLNPNGCPNDPHAVTDIAFTSVTTGTRTLFSQNFLDLIWLASDRIYLAYGPWMATLPLPP